MTIKQLSPIRLAWFTIVIMAILAAIYNVYLPAHPDEAYYWDWSRHLALSYYDGPPLMAYLLRIITWIFGSSAWSIKFTAVLCMTGGMTFVFLLARELFDEKTGLYAILILIFLPLTQAGYVIGSLDPPMFCFWSLTLYWFYLAASRDSNKYRYLAGIALGLTTLAKYHGVLLGVSLFSFFLFSHYRSQLRNINWYLAGLVSLLVFSPVLIWNWQQHWISFTFQYTHGVAQHKVFNVKTMTDYLLGQLGVANPIFLIAALYFSVRHLKKICLQRKLLLIALPFWVVFFFFFYNSLFKHANQDWAAPAYISAAILVAYFICQYQLRVLFYSLMTLSVILMIFVRFPVITPFIPKDAIILNQFLGYKQLIQQAESVYKPSDLVVSADRHMTAELALYLPGQPKVYILNNTKHQYAFWSVPIKKAILQGKIKSVLYIGPPNNNAVLAHYFKQQRFIKNLNYHGTWTSRHWVVIRAWNN